MKLEVNNPYYNKDYETDDITMDRWLNFLENHQRGNEDIIFFTDKDSQKVISINPKNFASIEVSE
ncbi:hypothetical protein [Enterococcus avium]|uniref:hypothetical protein n=1 Tax=Enterococcus avium TaxID=33945 RepID=UPI001C12084B|nr:hypothetical protein [Enterococcus avium]MBU5370939.1 hypothetical protein [Enterococcus avium]MDT2425054.1 hypothetical protein [Enterococcus avium]